MWDTPNFKFSRSDKLRYTVGADTEESAHMKGRVHVNLSVLNAPRYEISEEWRSPPLLRFA